jgi:hypothetical protein
VKTLTLVNECSEEVVHVSVDTSIPVLYGTRVLMKPWRKKVLWRVYGELRLNLPRRGKKWLHARIKQPLHAAGHPNHGLKLRLHGRCSGRRFRTFNVIDDSHRKRPRSRRTHHAGLGGKESGRYALHSG